MEWIDAYFVLFGVGKAILEIVWLAKERKNNKNGTFVTAHLRLAAFVFNGTMMLHGLYGGVEGRPVNAGDFLLYGYLALFDACPQQPILIQSQSDIPARVLPVEGWL